VRRTLRIVALGIATVLWFAAGGELISRFEGGWRIGTLTLQRRAAPAVSHARAATPLAVPHEDWADPKWFEATPPRLEKVSDPELTARTAANPAGMQQENYLWNSALLEHPEPNQIELIRSFKESTLFSFPSYDGTPYPRFRLYPDRDFRPAPWITNRWGWLSADMTVAKPPRTIRVGIVGDSTSHNFYGLYLQGFLNAWAEARGIGYRFEVANGGRQGFGFDDGLAVMKYELGPMGLDYVVEYFAPSFSLVPAAMLQLSGVQGGAEPGVPGMTHLHLPDAATRALAALTPYSALARQIRGDVTQAGANRILSEPAKPHVTMRLPVDANGDVTLERGRKNPYLAGIASRLDRFRSLSEQLQATPFVSTERLCAWPDMKLRGGAHDNLYRTLNGPVFWPFSYADLRQMLAAHNGLIATWAKANGVAVVDIDGRLPQTPDACTDPWHDNESGQRMRAWIIFETMVPRILRDIGSHAVPRDNAAPGGVHPYLDRPIERVDAAEWAARFAKNVQARNHP
jgi:hypothetical protein